MTSTSTASTSTTSAASLHQFLAAHRVEKGCEHTHTSLGRPLGSYYVPSSSHGRFLELYKAAVERGDDLFLTERHRHIGPVVVDLDFRYEPLAEELAALAPAPGSSPSTSLGRLPSPIMTMAAEASPSTAEAFKGGGGGSRRRHSGVVEAVVRSYCKAMVELVETPAEFDVYVTEKRSASLFKGLVKDGLHLAAPDVVTRPAVQLILRKDVLAALAEVFKPLGLANRVEDVVDEAVIERNNWMMYGSKKPGGEPYAVTRRYRYARGPITAGGEGTLSLVAAGQEASPAHYVELLSIRNKYDELGVREDHRDRVEAYITRVDEDRRRREAVQSVLSQAGPNPRANVCESLEQVQRLVSILDIRRVEAYDEWVRLGWCLRNIDHRLLETWVETSKRSPSTSRASARASGTRCAPAASASAPCTCGPETTRRTSTASCCASTSSASSSAASAARTTTSHASCTTSTSTSTSVATSRRASGTSSATTAGTSATRDSRCAAASAPTSTARSARSPSRSSAA